MSALTRRHQTNLTTLFDLDPLRKYEVKSIEDQIVFIDAEHPNLQKTCLGYDEVYQFRPCPARTGHLIQRAGTLLPMSKLQERDILKEILNADPAFAFSLSQLRHVKEKRRLRFFQQFEAFNAYHRSLLTQHYQAQGATHIHFWEENDRARDTQNKIRSVNRLFLTRADGNICPPTQKSLMEHSSKNFITGNHKRISPTDINLLSDDQTLLLNVIIPYFTSYYGLHPVLKQAEFLCGRHGEYHSSSYLKFPFFTDDLVKQSHPT